MNIKAAGIATLTLLVIFAIMAFMLWLASIDLLIQVGVIVVTVVVIGFIWKGVYDQFSKPEGKPEE